MAIEPELVNRFHKLFTKNRIKAEIIESDPTVGSSVLKITDRQQEINIPLVNNFTSLERNDFS